MRYSYNNHLKKLLRENADTYFVTKGNAPFVYRFHFPEIGKSMPIREHRVIEYMKWIPDDVA